MGQTAKGIPSDLVRKVVSDYRERLSQMVGALDMPAFEALLDVLEKARYAGSTVFIIGNGGSAATASHMAQDLSFGTRRRDGARLRAVSLADNMSYITAAANDEGYETIFIDQLRTLLHPEDVVIAISASGSSPNVVRAVEYANRHQATTVGILGFDGGLLRSECDLALLVESEKGDYGPVEDMHLIIDHLICACLNEI